MNHHIHHAKITQLIRSKITELVKTKISELVKTKITKLVRTKITELVKIKITELVKTMVAKLVKTKIIELIVGIFSDRSQHKQYYSFLPNTTLLITAHDKNSNFAFLSTHSYAPTVYYP